MPDPSLGRDHTQYIHSYMHIHIQQQLERFKQIDVGFVLLLCLNNHTVLHPALGALLCVSDVESPAFLQMKPYFLIQTSSAHFPS